MHDWLLWWQQRGSPASDWLSSVLYKYVGEEDLEVKRQAGNQVTPLSDIHCASFDVWVRDLGQYKVPALSPWCIWHMGTTQDLEDTVYSPCVKCGSQKNHWLFTALTWWLIDICGSSAILLAVHLARTTTEPLQRVSDKYCPTRPAGRPSHTWLCAVEADLGPLNFGLATAWRKATHYSRQVATYCGHSNAAVAYALKKRRRKK